jgi:hypothetical protein
MGQCSRFHDKSHQKAYADVDIALHDTYYVLVLFHKEAFLYTGRGCSCVYRTMKTLRHWGPRIPKDRGLAVSFQTPELHWDNSVAKAMCMQVLSQHRLSEAVQELVAC